MKTVDEIMAMVDAHANCLERKVKIMMRNQIEAALKEREGKAVARFVSGNDFGGKVTWLVHSGLPLQIGDLLYTAPPKAQPMSEWQPIATAPKDGTEFIGRRGDQIRFCSWEPLDNPVSKYLGIDGTWHRSSATSGKGLMGGSFNPSSWIPSPPKSIITDNETCAGTGVVKLEESE